MTSFEYGFRQTMDAYDAPHVSRFAATRVEKGNRYSSWGYAVECAICGAREENPGASSVSSEDAPPRFADAHRDCLQSWKRNELARKHIYQRIADIATGGLIDDTIPAYYGQELERLGKKLQKLAPHSA